MDNTKVYHCEQRTPYWYKIRQGLFTASDFAKLLTPLGKPSKAIKDLVLYKIAEDLVDDHDLMDSFSNEWMQRGQETEEEAVAYYEGKTFVNVDNSVGFISIKGYGYSPDGLVNDDGIIEVKCLKHVNHLKAFLECDKKYYPQIQGGLLVTGRQWCDLIFYNPDFDSNYKIKVYRIEREEEYIENLKKALEGAVSMKNELVKELENEKIS